jgi:putative ABC transport system permease protein
LWFEPISQPQTLAGAVRQTVEGIDKNQPLSEARTMDDIIVDSVAPRRFQMLLLGLFALLALVLAAVGIYGLFTHSCSQRTHEFGIRMALGAERRHILKVVVGQGFRLTLIGVGIGLAGGLALTRLVSSLLYGVKSTAP